MRSADIQFIKTFKNLEESYSGHYNSLESCDLKGSRGFESHLLRQAILLKQKIMKGFFSNIEKDTLENDNFRKVLYTSKCSQLVLMSLKPKEEIGMETHNENDQFFRIEKGMGKCIIDGNEYDISDGSAIVVPSGSQHNVINISDSEALKLYTIYSPAHHKDGVVRKTKEEATADSPEFDGKTTE